MMGILAIAIVVAGVFALTWGTKKLWDDGNDFGIVIVSFVCTVSAISFLMAFVWAITYLAGQR